MFARTPCKLTSNNKLIKTKRRTLHSSKKQIMHPLYNRKRIIKGVEFHLRNFVGLARTLLKKYYQITINWYANFAPTRRKCFIVCECVSSHHAYHQLTYESSHKTYKPDPEKSLNYDDLYARAWEFHYEQPIFDVKNNNATPPNSHDTPVKSDLSTEEMRNTLGTAH